MPMSIIDGSNANIDISINSNSMKAQFNYWTANLVRDFFDATTFASGGWRSRIPMMKQLLFSATGYVSSGVASSDPSVQGFTDQTSVPVVLTADTGCTFTFSGHVGSSQTGMRAAANSEFSISGESTGTVTVAWVVA